MLRRKRMLALGFISIFYFSLVFPPFNSFEVDAFPPAFFTINILVPNNNIELGQIAILLSSMLPRIGIGVDIIDIVDIGTVYNRTYNHPSPYPIPRHVSGGYDMVLLEQ
ncbi:MAG: hypothetical protein KAJ76_06340, partial [Candidatus Heimdallarchaeota archaeon]|nr:hypothetical protein [Candidatus Heimdallarchaeota archaeon]